MIVISAQAFPPASGGIQGLMHGLAAHLAERGHEVLALADGGGEARLFDRAESRFATRRFGGPRPLRRWRKARAIAALLRGGGVQAIFCDSWKSLEALPGGGAAAAPVLAFAHGNEFPADGAKRARIRRATSRATRLLAVSADTLERARPFLPPTCEPSVFHPPIEAPAQTTAADAAAAEMLWPDHGPRLLAVARLEPLKGLDRVIAALPDLRAAHAGTQLVIAGTGEDRVRLELMAAEAGLSDAVRFAGRVEGGAKSALFDSAELFVQPGRRDGARREGFGLVYLEAALHGLPAICGAEGGAPEAIRVGETGLIVDGDDPEAVRAAIAGLLADPARRARMAEAARAHGAAALWSNRIDALRCLAGLA